MYIGIDLGSSSVKAVLLTQEQSVVAEASAGLLVSRPQDGWSEQNPAGWIVAVENVLDSLAAQQDLSGVKGIGLAGQMHGATVLDASDRVLRPCILWNDTRASIEAAQLDDNKVFRKTTGNIVFPGFTAPKLLWMKHHEPGLFDKAAKILLPKDYIRFWLTGEHVSEMSDAAGTSWLDTGRREWSDKLLTATGLDRSHMPRLVEGNQPAGALRSALASRWGFSKGIIVAGGAGDNAATAIGVGVTRPGEAFVSLGTSGVLFAASERYTPDPETAVHTFCHAIPDTWHQMGVVLAAADSLTWLANLTEKTPAELVAHLGDLQKPDMPTFLPYLGGERTPLNDSAIRGAFTGIAHLTDRKSMTRAVLEGVGFALRDCQSALAETGTEINSLIAVGGGSASTYWLKSLATILDIPISVPVAGDFGAAYGAARLGLMAAEGAGVEVAQPPEIQKIYEPETKLTVAFDDAYARFKEVQTAIGALK